MAEENKEAAGQVSQESEKQLAGSNESIPPKTQQTRPAPSGSPAHHEAGLASSSPSKDSKKSDDEDEEDISDTANGIIKLPIAAFTRRVQRERNKTLRELFGTDNISEILEMKKALDAYKTREEEERKKSLAEIERIREEAAEHRKAREEAESHLEEIRIERMAEKKDEELRLVAVEYIKPKFWKHVAEDLRDYLVEEYGDNLEDVNTKVLREFFKQYAEENPEYALEQRTVPVTNGSTAPRPTAPGSGSAQGKTFKPGQPNSMSTAEYRAALRERGLSY